MNKKEFKLHQGIKFWNIIFTIFFIFLNLFAFILLIANNKLPISFSYLELLILILATFRMVRLFVYDNITLFLRELFMDLKVIDDKYYFEESNIPFKRTIYKLLLCPWCFGVWSASMLTTIYFLIPEFRIFIFILAVSSIGTLFQLLANLVGWYAEGKKIEVQGK